MKTLTMSTHVVDTPLKNLIIETIETLGSNLLTSPKHVGSNHSQFKNLWQNLSQLGLHGLPQHFRASQTPFCHQLQWDVIQKISHYNPGIALSYLAHNILVLNPLMQHSQNSWHQYCLNALISGSVGSCAISETGAGSDIMSMRTVAREYNDHYIIEGEKTWITNAPFADYILLYCKIDDKNSRNIGAFIIETKDIDIVRSPSMQKIGMHSSPTGSVLFKKIRIDKKCRLDTPQYNGKRILFEQLDYERLMLAAGPVGIMSWCLEKTQDYMRTRVQFGQTIGKFQLLQGHIADMFTSYQASKAYAEKALALYRHNELDQKTAASAYLFCSEQGLKVADLALQCAGANGYMQETRYGDYLHDAKLYTIGGGTSEIRRWVIGRSLLEN